MTDQTGMAHSPRLDKENIHNRMSEFKTPSRKTPSRHQQQDHALFLTPPGSSKLLRRHFQQLSVTPHTMLQSGAVRLFTPKRTNLQSGAVRLTPLIPTTTPRRKKALDRVGYDGTHKTPSKELLKSTACSRGHRISQHHVHGDSSSAPFVSQPQHQDTDSIVTMEEPISSSDERLECCDPVALTLSLNDGMEDFQLLLEQDTSTESHAIQKVSSSLLDVMDHEGVSTLVRPVPKIAR